MSKVVGIDLGTTFSVVAYVEKGKPKVIPSTDGGFLIPSVVAFTEDGFKLVGKLAKAQATANPHRTIVSVKRWMGSDRNFEIHGDVYNPQQISGLILNKFKKEAEAFLGEDIKKAVITVPAYFNDNQRQATVEAATLAGLEVMRIINEPTAAAIAYGLDKEEVHHILIWDLGGGTFDVSILEFGQGVIEVKAVSGNTRLGGDDWDRRIMNYLAEEFKDRHKTEVREDPIALQRLMEASEKAKIELSWKSTTNIRIPFIIQERVLETSLSRLKFEELTKDLLYKIISPTEQAMKDAKLKPGDIDRVILVGGSTRMPAVQQLARTIFGKEPYKEIDPDKAVACGAAILAGVLEGEVNEIALVDVNPLSVGIETMGSIFTKIIERNTPIPVSRSQIFTTADNNQTQMDIHILQGERALASDNISLGKFILHDIPLARRGEPQIEVIFQIDTSGILQVSALDLHTENKKGMKLSSPKRLSQEQIKKILDEANQYADDDKKRKECIQVGIRAESMIASAGMVIEEGYEVLLDKSQIDKMEKAVLKVKASLAQGKKEKIELKTEELKALIQRTYTEIKRKKREHYNKQLQLKSMNDEV